MTGGRGLSFAGSILDPEIQLRRRISASVSSSAGAASSSAVVSMPSSVATSVAVSKSMDVVDRCHRSHVHERPDDVDDADVEERRELARPRSSSAATTGGRPSMTATGARPARDRLRHRAAGAAAGGPRGRGPRCGGKRRGRALGTSGLLLSYASRSAVLLAIGSAVTPSIAISSALASAPSASPRSRHAWIGVEIRAPSGGFAAKVHRELARGERTMRTSSRFARDRPAGDAGPLRRGRRATPAVPFGLTAFLLLLGSQECSILFVQVLLVRHARTRPRPRR